MPFSAPDAVLDPKFVVHPNNSVTATFTPPSDPEDPSKKIKDFIIRYTSDDPPTDDTDWKELKVTDADDTDGTVVRQSLCREITIFRRWKSMERTSTARRNTRLR